MMETTMSDCNVVVGEIINEILSEFAAYILPDIRSFYASSEGQQFFEKFLLDHPELDIDYDYYALDDDD